MYHVSVARLALLRLYDGPDEFGEIVLHNEHLPVRLYVYSVRTEDVREVIITPDREWGGGGVLGCETGSGYLHTLPPRRDARRRARAKAPPPGAPPPALAAPPTAAAPVAEPASDIPPPAPLPPPVPPAPADEVVAPPAPAPVEAEAAAPVEAPAEAPAATPAAPVDLT
jgi:hypothetical protein